MIRKTIEDLHEEMRSLVEGADGPLSEEQCTRYEELEGQLKQAQRGVEILKRNEAYNSAITPVYATVDETDDTLDRAFEHYMRTGQKNSDLVELRAQSEGTPSEGGYLVPDGFRMKLVDRMKAFGGIANDAETLVTSSGNPMEYPTCDDTANVGEIVAEGNTFAGGADIVFGTVTLGAYKYMAGGGSNLPLRVSVELLQDSAFDVQSFVASKLGERIARIQATHLVTGSGSSQPKGLIHGKTPVTPAAGTGIVYDDLITFIHSVDPAYRNGARWAFNDQSLAMIKKLKDSHGDPIWRPADADMGTTTGGGVLLGYPVTIDQAFPDIDIDNTAINWGAFGDFREGYVIRRVKDVTLVVDPYGRAANGQVQFTAWARMDGNVQNPNSYIALSGKS